MPKMIKDVSWKEVKEKIKTEVKKMIPLWTLTLPRQPRPAEHGLQKFGDGV
jgi:hypothetical protein